MKAIVAALAAFVVAVASGGTQSQPFGRPLAGITPVEFEEFRLGLEDFLEVEAAEEGLGPAFNGTSCAVCHNVPAIGGAGTIAQLRAAKINAPGEFTTLHPPPNTTHLPFSPHPPH